MTIPEYEHLSHLPERPNRSCAANLPLVDEANAEGEVAILFEYFRSHFGRQDVPGILKCFATHPPLLRHMMQMSESLIFSDGSLGRRHKEMIATLVSEQNACRYCADSHSYFLRLHGGSAEVLYALQHNDLSSPSLSAGEQALLRFVLKVNANSAQIERADVESLRDHGWRDLQIAEAVHVASLFATFNRVANSFGLPSQGLLELYQREEDTRNMEQTQIERAL